MTGLRQRKKAATRKRILDCASQMFRDDGYEASRIEDIAERAETSVATFYNYFGSKADLLLATVVEETSIVLSAVDACIDAEHATLRAAFAAVVHVYFRTSFEYTSREVWRMAVARTMLDPEAEFCRKYIAIDHTLSDQLCRCLAVLQSRGLLRADADTTTAGRLLFNNVNMNFLEYMRDPDRTSEEICAKVCAESEPVFASLTA